MVVVIRDDALRPCLMRAASRSCLDELVDALPEELSVIYLQRLQWMKVCLHAWCARCGGPLPATFAPGHSISRIRWPLL
jgi:hypothetical protein